MRVAEKADKRIPVAEPQKEYIITEEQLLEIGGFADYRDDSSYREMRELQDEIRSRPVKESSDKVLDELESKRAKYEALLNDYTSCSDEFDRGLIEGKLVVCVILREWIVELRTKEREQ